MTRILFESSQINTMRLKNRLVRSATYEGMATEEGRVTENLVKLYEQLSRGGVGLIIAGYAYVQKSGRCASRQTAICDDDCISGVKEIVDAAHQGGARIAMQIVHSGRQTAPALIGDATPVAPSVMAADPLFHTVPRAMTVDEIQETVDAFAAAAVRCKRAGFDAVQLHAAHGYLLAQFLSPYTNRRDDGWGGHIENRMRFPLLVLDKVREAVGPDYPVLIKISAEEGVDGGMTVDEACVVAKALKEHGVDAIEVSGGILVDTPFKVCRGDVPIDLFTQGLEPKTKAQAESTFYSIADTVSIKEAYWAANAEKIKAEVGELPVMLVGGMRYPQKMAALVNGGVADYISLSRPLIREPNLPLEIAEGRKSPVSCSFCNRCLAKLSSGQAVKCYNR